MLTNFWDAMGTKLADRWLALSVPALVFWSGGAVAGALGDGSFTRLAMVSAWLETLSPIAQLAVLVAVLLAVAASGVVVARAGTSALRLLEGRWPWPLHTCADDRALKYEMRAGLDVALFEKLADLDQSGTADAAQQAEYADVSSRLRRLPARPPFMPTRVGNLLRAAETRPEDKYGLSVATVWPHLWLVMPEISRKELATAREALDDSVTALCWGLLFVAFTPWSWWALPVGLVVAAAALLYWVPERAEVYVDQLETAIDLYHTRLFTALRWPLPAGPSEDYRLGRLLSTYLERGLAGAEPKFTDRPAPEASP